MGTNRLVKDRSQKSGSIQEFSLTKLAPGLHPHVIAKNSPPLPLYAVIVDDMDALCTPRLQVGFYQMAISRVTVRFSRLCASMA